jgi:cell division protein FtsI/penicillin-binding protein 2
VPASTPRLVILVAINEPQGQIFGGLVAAPAFRDIARFALQYLDVPPDDLTSLRGAGGAPPG